MKFNSIQQKHNSVRRWVCRIVHELIVQDRESIEYTEYVKVQFD
jgi:hypothetical protein